MRAERPKARQSQLVTTYGVGALFPAGDQSLMICGIDEWDDRWAAEVEEPRLARSLGVQAFKAPPTGRRAGDVPSVRFPYYHYCPGCRRLDVFWRFDAVTMECRECDRELTPSRFVACCEDGHIEDFPYFQWVHRGADVAPGARHSLSLTSRGASSSLADIVISCTCGVPSYDLDGSFGRGALREVKSCGGHRPWLPSSADEACRKPLRVLQRGSSNVWFSTVRSAISIPPWSSPDARFVNKHWALLSHLPAEQLEMILGPLVATDRTGVTAEGIKRAIERRRGIAMQPPPTEADLRNDEYHALVDGHDGDGTATFKTRAIEVSASVAGLVVQVSAVDRLREVRALHGFTRVTASPTATASPRVAKLSSKPLDWLPATEVLGEGVFFRVSEELLATWEQSELARSRHRLLEEAMRHRDAGGDAEAKPVPSLRFLAMHSLAHMVLKELSLDAGYPVGALRERVYAEGDQAGILIYTASSDAAGSLGGLAALAQTESFARAVLGAVSRGGWCTNDPVCSESAASGSDGMSLSACHACMLLPETSCESMNVFLDRTLVAGPPGVPEEGLAGILRV